MPYVYILKSIVTNKYYTGCTNNYKRRIIEHNSGKVPSTKYFRPFIVKLVQYYPNLRVARKIEYKLKGLKRKDYLDKIIKDRIIKMTT